MARAVMRCRMAAAVTMVALLCLLSNSASAEVVLSLTSGTVRFPSMEADFGPSLTSQGYTGMLVVGVPRDGCGPLQPAAANVTQFVLLERGGNPICEFDEKVLRAEEAGYSAAIIYDTIDEGLIVMRGRQNVDIPSVFVTHSAGVILSQHANNAVLLLPEDVPQWPSFLVTFIVIICCAVFFATIFTVYHTRQRNRRAVALRTQTMSASELNRLTTRKFRSGDEENSCCICLEEFKPGDELTVLVCNHEFHKSCITPWLRERRRVCPLCKRDPLSSERTSLLGHSNPPTYATSAVDVENDAALTTTAAATAAPTPATAAAQQPHGVDADEEEEEEEEEEDPSVDTSERAQLLPASR